jgi:hypothetical protein
MEKRSNHFLRLAGRVLIGVLAMSVVVLVLGYILGWHELVTYSNAFFWAGAIWVVIGVFSVTSGFQQRANFGMTYAQTVSDANISERNQQMDADITERYGAMIFMTVTGLLLIGVAVATGQFFIG